MPNVVIATTMWSEVKEKIGERREAELKRNYWKGMMADGCRTERFENTYESAWRIIGNMSQTGVNVLIQKEMESGDQTVDKTSAGRHVNRRHLLQYFVAWLRGLFWR